jgi:hypothetical protein
VHVPHLRRRAGDQDEEHPRPDGAGSQVVLGDPVLAFPAAAVDDGNPLRPGERPHPPREPARRPHQVGVVELGLGAAVQLPPPDAEPARAVPQRVVGVQHDPVHAVVAAGQQVGVPFTQLVRHAAG